MGCCADKQYKHRLAAYELDLSESKEWFNYGEQTLLSQVSKKYWY